MQRYTWKELDETARRRVLERPATATSAERRDAVAKIIARVRADGDAALRSLTEELDGARVTGFRVPDAERKAAAGQLTASQRDVIRTAHDTLTRFHAETGRSELRLETVPGVECRRVVRPLERVGLYVPGGSAPLPSTTLMLGVPASLAGCDQVVLCTPPREDGSVDPAILYAAELCGISEIFTLGGAQAIAAMAFGTESVPGCDKLFGPGNSWVTEAKQQVALDPAGALADMPAGPSEVLVIADASASPVAVAADLLSQAEHGPDSQVILVAMDAAMAQQAMAEVDAQLQRLPRADIAGQALAQSRVFLAADRGEALDISNAYAPEHLIINTVDSEDWLDDVQHAGSVFLGPNTPESLGDYCSGTNHVLPTYGYARALGGLSVAEFQKSFTVQSATPAGLQRLGPVAITLAELEGLEAHANAVRVRLAELDREVANES
ncbi:MAG: histidinol dehydrogenase [Gammaproteobacteria bacterium]|nr:histidinol dehydrogenase [Gammaproteobacteria bacterium]